MAVKKDAAETKEEKIDLELLVSEAEKKANKIIQAAEIKAAEVASQSNAEPEQPESHEQFIALIADINNELTATKVLYKEFCISNPLKTPKPLSISEIRKIQNKTNRVNEGDHNKSNTLAAQTLNRETLKREISGSK